MCLGIPGRITEITDETRKLALVEISGVRRQVNLACIAPADAPLDSLVGQWTLVHVGFAMSLINEEEAAETLRVLTALGEAQEEIAAMKQSAVQL